MLNQSQAPGPEQKGTQVATASDSNGMTDANPDIQKADKTLLGHDQAIGGLANEAEETAKAVEMPEQTASRCAYRGSGPLGTVEAGGQVDRGRNEGCAELRPGRLHRLAKW